MSYPSDRYRDFWAYQSTWSQETFGTDKERGPMGPLLHLQKEVKEAIAEVYNPDSGTLVLDRHGVKEVIDSDLHMEIVDCFFLVTDAARRSGLQFDDFMDLCFKKLEINQNRKWSKPTSDMPVEHDRSED